MGLLHTLKSFLSPTTRAGLDPVVGELPLSSPVDGAPRPLTPAEEHRFQELVERYFASHGQRAVFAANGALSLNGKLSAALCLDLEALHEKCTRAKPRDWESVVRVHFDALLGLAAPAKPDIEDVDDLEVARTLLVASPVLGEGSSPLLEGSGGIVYRRDLEGIPTVLFLQLRSGLRPVEKRLFEKWGRRPSELFRIALKNVRRELKLETSPLELDGGRRGVVLRSDSELSAACVYFLGAVPGASGALGSIFVIPHAQCVLSSGAEEAGDLDVVPRLLLDSAGKHAAGSAGSRCAAYHWNGTRFLSLSSS